MKTLFARLLDFLACRPSQPVQARPTLPEHIRRHMEAQDRGDFETWR